MTTVLQIDLNWQVSVFDLKLFLKACGVTPQEEQRSNS